MAQAHTNNEVSQREIIEQLKQLNRKIDRLISMREQTQLQTELKMWERASEEDLARAETDI